MDILWKIRHLIALTDNSNRHEAQNAALAAVSLIRKHRVLDSVRPPPRALIRQVALDKVDRLITFLSRKAWQGSYPYYTARELVERSVQDGLVQEVDRLSFNRYLRGALRARVKSGQLDYQRGKGYRLRSLIMWEDAA